MMDGCIVRATSFGREAILAARLPGIFFYRLLAEPASKAAATRKSLRCKKGRSLAGQGFVRSAAVSNPSVFLLLFDMAA